MALIVQKYGGTSVGNPDRIKNVAQRVLATQQAGNQVVVVVSAMSGVTDSLIKLAKEVHPEPPERDQTVVTRSPATAWACGLRPNAFLPPAENTGGA